MSSKTKRKKKSKKQTKPQKKAKKPVPLKIVEGAARTFALRETTDLFFRSWDQKGQHKHDVVFAKIWKKLRFFPHAQMSWWHFMDQATPKMQSFIFKLFVNDVVNHMSHDFVVRLM